MPPKIHSRRHGRWIAAVLLFLVLPYLPGESDAGFRVLRGEAEKITLLVGRSRVVELDLPISQVSITDPSVADVLVASSRQVLINGKSQGATTLVVWDQAEQSTFFDLVVRTDIINSQVVLQVRFAEINRQALRELGVDWLIADNPQTVFKGDWEQVGARGMMGETGDKLLGGIAEDLTTSTTAILSATINGDQFTAVIKALEEEGLVTTLAQPNLVAISGEEANFLAGGEYPVPIVTQNTINVDYKEFGVRLNFKPTVVDSGIVNLVVEPEVSTVDFDNAVVLQGFRIPALRTRRAKTTVELASGDSLVLAGLLQGELGEVIRKVPLFGDVPILGWLFRSERYQAEETELVIVITPTIARSYSAVQTPPARF
jgi:Flp pilus assembly secretin CpaC